MPGKKAAKAEEGAVSGRKPTEARNHGRDMLVKDGLSIKLAEDVVNHLAVPLVERLSGELEAKLGA